MSTHPYTHTQAYSSHIVRLVRLMQVREEEGLFYCQCTQREIQTDSSAKTQAGQIVNRCKGQHKELLKKWASKSCRETVKQVTKQFVFSAGRMSGGQAGNSPCLLCCSSLRNTGSTSSTKETLLAWLLSSTAPFFETNTQRLRQPLRLPNSSVSEGKWMHFSLLIVWTCVGVCWTFPNWNN